MAKANETWYDRQALVSKLITYAAILVFVGCFAWGLYILHLSWDRLPEAVVWGVSGVAVPAFLVGVSAIIDLLIVNAEALRAGKR
jgi:hypothetical protein